MSRRLESLEERLLLSVDAGLQGDLDRLAVAEVAASFVAEAPALAQFSPHLPRGSLIQEGASGGSITAPGLVESLPINLDAGQTITIVARPAGALRTRIELLAPSGTSLGTSTSAAAATPAWLQTLPVAAAGSYTLRISGEAGTTGTYTLSVLLNSAVELAGVGGPTNNTLGTAQDLAAAFVALDASGAARAAVRGSGQPGADDYYRFSLLAGESVTLAAAGNVSLELLTSAGSRLADGVTATNLDEVITQFISLTGGTFMARVSAQAAGDYSLVVMRNAGFDAEGNSNFEAAQVVTGAQGVLGHVLTTAGGDHQFDTPILNYNGQGFNGVQPTDTVGDVGMAHFIQALNHPDGTSVTIYNKADGSVALGPFILNTLAPPGSPGQSGAGDPIVLYDHLADRWLLAEFTSPAAGSYLNVYISQTSDPTANLWYYYSVSTPDFPDYPKIGVWSDGYYVTTNESVPTAYVLDRERMLLGQSARPAQRFSAPRLAGFPFQALIPADLDGSPPPPGSPGYFLRHRDDEVHNVGGNDPARDFLEVWELRTDFTTPQNSTFTLTATIPIAEIDSDLCGLVSFFCFPQPGTTTTLDPVREVIMHRLQYRNFGSHETLVGNFVTDVDGTDHGGIRWFELRKSGAGAWSLYQEGTVAPDADHRWIGSIAMDGLGNIALTYNVTSATVSPGIRYLGRFASDPLGTMPQGEHVLVAGQGYNASNRWGDYSALTVDPVDGRTFWFTGQYASGTAWNTRIASFQLESPTDHDWFRFNVRAGDQLVIETFTPADGPGEFANLLDPWLELYAADGEPVTSNDNASPGDGRNARLNHTAASTGQYRLRVSASAGAGEYYVRIQGATGTNEAPTVVGTSPANGVTVGDFPAVLTVDFSESLYLPSVQAADLVVGGRPALSVVPVDGNTLQFTPDPAAYTGAGLYSVQFAAGRVMDLQAWNNLAFAGEFRVDTQGPRVTSTLWNGVPLPAHVTIPPGSLQFEANFDEPIKAFFRAGRGLRTPDAGDILLVNDSTGQAFMPFAVNSNTETNTFRADFNPLPEGSYTLTLLSGPGAFEDPVGNALDGEPAAGTPDGTPSGDGVQGGDYVVHFLVDQPPITVQAFERVEPLGGLVFRSTGNVGFLYGSTDVDQVLVALSAGEHLSLSATGAADASLTVEVAGLASPVSAAAGAPVVLSGLSVPADGIYEVHVSANRATPFEVVLYRNALWEAAVGDSADGNELPLGTSLPLSGGERRAVVGLADVPLAGPLAFAHYNDLGRFVDISATGTPLNLTDDGTATITTTVGNAIFPAGAVSVANNGGILAGAGRNLSFSNGVLPISSFAETLLPFWDDIDSDTGNVYWQERLVEGIQTLIVQWDNRPHFSNVGSATFQLQLFASGPLLARFAYRDVRFGNATFDYGASATIGYQQSSSTAVQHSYNVAAVSDGDVLDLARAPQGVDVDEYLLDLTGGTAGPLDIVLAGRDGADFSVQSLQLLDVDGSGVLATASSDPLQTGTAVTNYDLGILNADSLAPGVYTLRLTTTNLRGSYVLLVGRGLAFDSEPNDAPTAPAVRGLNATGRALGMLGPENLADTYDLDLTLGQSVSLATRTLLDTAGGLPGNDLDPELVVLAPGGETVAGDLNSRDGSNARLTFTALAEGRYSVQVLAASGAGEYLLEMPPPLRIAEVMYDPASAEPAWQWVELFNAGASDLDLAGFVLDNADAVSLTAANIPGGFVPAGGSAVLYNANAISAGDFTAAWGSQLSLIPVYGWPQLASTGGTDAVGLWPGMDSYRGDFQNHYYAWDTVTYRGPGQPASNNSASIYRTRVITNHEVVDGWTRSQAGTDGAYRSQAAGGNSGSDAGSPGAAWTPRVIVQTPESGIEVTEGGATGSYEIALAAAPSGPVQITITTDAQTQVSLDGVDFVSTLAISLPNTLPRTIIVRAVDDALPEGPHVSFIQHAITGSSDPRFPTTLPISGVIASVADNDIDLQSGLVAYWNFDDVAASNVPDNAVSGLVADKGTLIGGATAVNAGLGLALRTLGNGAHVAVSSSSDINVGTFGQRSISLWFHADDVQAAGRQVLYEQGGTERGLNVYLENGRLYAGGWNIPASQSGWGGTWLSGPVTSLAWHHVALVLNGGSSVQPGALQVYLDGVPLAEGGGAGSQLWAHTNAIGIGAINSETRFPDGPARTPSGSPFRGYLDDVRVYSRALTDTDVNVLRTSVLTTPPGVDFSKKELVGSEDGGVDSYNLALRSVPGAPVQIQVTADAQALVSLDGLVFTPSVAVQLVNTTPATIWVRAADDEIPAEEVHSGVIQHAIAASADPAYPLTMTLDAVVITIQDNDPDLQAALVAYWNFDDVAASSVPDSAPAGSILDPGTLLGGATIDVAGLGAALRTPGSGARVAVNSSSDINVGTFGQRSISLWFYADDVQAVGRQVIYEQGGTDRGLNIYLQNGQLYAGGWNIPASQSGWGGTWLSGPVTSLAWQHVALVLNGTSSVQPGALQVYLNGVPLAEGGGAGSQLWTHTNAIGIGAINSETRFPDGPARTPAGSPFRGYIDEVRVYNRVLSSIDLAALAGQTLLDPGRGPPVSRGLPEPGAGPAPPAPGPGRLPGVGTDARPPRLAPDFERIAQLARAKAQRARDVVTDAYFAARRVRAELFPSRPVQDLESILDQLADEVGRLLKPISR